MVDNPAQRVSGDEERAMTSRNLEVLTQDECIRLLHTQFLGRVAVRFGEAPSVLPVNYAMLDDDIVFKTEPGTKLSAAIMQAVVAFEVDDADPATRTGWSVLVVGPVEEITDRATLERVDETGLEAWPGDGRDRVLRIRTRTATGRRIVNRFRKS
jgi:nitroimidazol reductase NimA-like FMN-containing flavoprotein (pyridoxamine 5'-phosphate oxidase superfamily)